MPRVERLAADVERTACDESEVADGVALGLTRPWNSDAAVEVTAQPANPAIEFVDTSWYQVESRHDRSHDQRESLAGEAAACIAAAT